jgi:glycogen operon protein
MLLAGDEFGRTQGGNNNAYCQDNDISWVDWDHDEDAKALIIFVANVARIRRTFPILRRERFLTGGYNETLDIKEITWLNPAGEEMSDEHWGDNAAKCMGLVLDGRAQPTGIRKRGIDRTLLLVLNAYHDVVDFALPSVTGGMGWMLLIDTNRTDGPGNFRFDSGTIYGVTGRSVLLFELEPEGSAAGLII